MKYLKFFEAFESELLSGILKFINKNDKKKFLDIIKAICNIYNYPMGGLSDEFFEYLPYRQALKYDHDYRKKCIATSIGMFGSSGIEGKSCENGVIERMWGKNIRKVKCPACKGTGFKITDETILIKFWFTSDGNYLLSTSSTDASKPDESEIKKEKENEKYDMLMPLDINFFKRTGQMLTTDSIKNGMYAYIKIRSDDPPVVCYLYKPIYCESIYAIQNHHNGDRPKNTEDWKKQGNYSWIISYGDYYSIELLEIDKEYLKKQEYNKKYKDNIFYNNYYLEIYNTNFYINKNKDIKPYIREASFALILNVYDLKKSEYEKVEDIQTKRKETKKDSLLDKNKSNENIKKQNIERYLNIIINKLNLPEDITTINRLFKKISSNKYSLFFLLSNNINLSNYVNDFVDSYLDMIQCGDDDEKSNIYSRISKKSKEIYLYINDHLSSLTYFMNNNINSLRSNSEEHSILIDNILKISSIINDKISNFKFDTIEDIENSYLKYSSIISLLTSRRYFGTYSLSYFANYISDKNERSALYTWSSKSYTNTKLLNKNISYLLKSLEKI